MLLGDEIFLVLVGGLFTACSGLFDKRANADRMALSRSLARYAGGMFLCLAFMLLTIASLAVRFAAEGKLDSSSTAAVLAIAIELGKVRDNAKRLLTVAGHGKELLQALRDVVRETENQPAGENFLVHYSSATEMAFATVDDSDFMKNGVLMMLSSWNDAWYNVSSIFWAIFGCCWGYGGGGGCGGEEKGYLAVVGHIVKTVGKSLLVAVGRITLLPLNLLTMLIGMLVLAVGVVMIFLDIPFAYLVYFNITRHVPGAQSTHSGVDVQVSIEEIFGGIEGGKVAGISIADILAEMLHLGHPTHRATAAGENGEASGHEDYDVEIKDKILEILRQCVQSNELRGSASLGPVSWIKVFMDPFWLGRSARSPRRLPRPSRSTPPELPA